MWKLSLHRFVAVSLLLLCAATQVDLILNWLDFTIKNAGFIWNVSEMMASLITPALLMLVVIIIPWRIDVTDVKVVAFYEGPIAGQSQKICSIPLCVLCIVNRLIWMRSPTILRRLLGNTVRVMVCHRLIRLIYLHSWNLGSSRNYVTRYCLLSIRCIWSQIGYPLVLFVHAALY